MRENSDRASTTSRLSPPSDRARSAPKALNVSCAGDVLREVGEESFGVVHSPPGAQLRGRVVGRHAHHQHREEGRRHQRQPGIAGPEHNQQHGHQRPVDHRGEGRPADRLTHLVGVVDAGEDLADLPRLEELQGQSLEVAGIPRDQGQVHLAADVRHQVLPEHAEHGPEEDDQHHADAQRVEQPPLVVYEHGVHEVLDEVGGGYPQHGHEDRADEALGQDGGVGGQQAKEPPPGTDGGGARRRTGLPLTRDDQQQVVGPDPAELVAREGFDPARRVGQDDGALPDAVDDDEMPRSLVVAEVCDGRQRHTAQGLVRAPGALGRKAERLGGLHHRQEACAATVRTDQVAKLEEADGPAVVQRDRRQRRGATVAPVLLVNNHVSMQHVRTPWKMGSDGGHSLIGKKLYANCRRRGVAKNPLSRTIFPHISVTEGFARSGPVSGFQRPAGGFGSDPCETQPQSNRRTSQARLRLVRAP